MHKTARLLGFLWIAAFATAQDRDVASWTNLERLQRGGKIEVVDVKFKSYVGAFDSVGPDTLTVTTTSGPQVLRRESVLRVSSRAQSKRLRNTLIGAAIGGGAGLAIGAIADKRFSNEGREHIAKTIFIPVGLGAGAGLGAASAGFETIYRADRNAIPPAAGRK